MNSNRSARIILGGLLLVLAAGALRWGLSRPEATADKPDATAGSVTSVEQERQTTSTRPRPGVRLRSASRPSSSPKTNQATPAPQQRLYVEWRGTWYAAEILTSSGDSHYIRYSGYGSEWDEWVTSERMRYSDLGSAPPQNPTPPADQTVTARMTPEPGDPVVLHGGQWWRAEVLKTEGDKSLIRYVGYGAEWDEWVGPDRFKVYSEEDARNSKTPTTLTTELTTEWAAAPEPEASASRLVQGNPANGDLLVQWGNMWWPAEILKQDGSSYFIHYKNYGTNWDEWVTLDRIGHYTGAQ